MNSNCMIATMAGRKLKELRTSAGYTVPKFTQLIGCKSEQQLYRYERGINKIDLDTLIVALKLLNVSVGNFMDEVVSEVEEKEVVE